MTCFTCYREIVLPEDGQTYTVGTTGKPFEFTLCMGCRAIAQYYYVAICEICGAIFWVNYDKKLAYPRLLFTNCQNMGRRVLCKQKGDKRCVH